jgi:hypothetical protein
MVNIIWRDYQRKDYTDMQNADTLPSALIAFRQIRGYNTTGGGNSPPADAQLKKRKRAGIKTSSIPVICTGKKPHCY